MKVFIDCEWSNSEFISMALVAEDGTEFYEAVKPWYPNPWVKHNVLPVINKPYVVLPEFLDKLKAYVSQYPTITLIADWPKDIAWFCDLLVDGPNRFGPERLFFVVDSSLFQARSLVPHNALEDARAIQRYWQEHKAKQ